MPVTIHAHLSEKETLTATLNVTQSVDPSGTIDISENGTYDVKAYANADVNVPQPAGTISITENGDFDVSEYAEARVKVSDPGWIRPDAWPNFDLLREDDYSLYMTFDNTEPPTRLSVCATPDYLVEQVRIEDDGTITVLDSVQASSGGIVAFIIPESAGDYPCYRVRGVNGADITGFGLQGNGSNEVYYYNERIVERWFNLPACSTTFEFGYRAWRNRYTQQDTFVNVSPNMNAMDMRDMFSLRSLRVLGNTPIKVSVLQNNKLVSNYPFDKITWTAANFNNMLSQNNALKEADLSAMSMTGKTNLGSMFYACSELERVVLPGGDYSGITNIGDIFRECYSLKGELVLPASLTCPIGNTAFNSCYNLYAIVLLSETLMPLANLNAFGNIVYPNQTVKVYVRQSLLESYKTATNWSTLYNTNNNFLQAIEGSKYEYLLME